MDKFGLLKSWTFCEFTKRSFPRRSVVSLILPSVSKPTIVHAENSFMYEDIGGSGTEGSISSSTDGSGMRRYTIHFRTAVFRGAYRETLPKYGIYLCEREKWDESFGGLIDIHCLIMYNSFGRLRNCGIAHIFPERAFCGNVIIYKMQFGC